MFLLHLLSGFFIFIFVLLGVAFYTFMERKFLGFFHFRFGPNKVFFGGFQPFSDALSLFLKFGFKMKYFNYYIYCFMPLIGLLLMLIFWVFYPFYGGFCFSNIGFLFFFCVSGMGVYFFLISGWSSGSSYSYYGAYRSSAQSISYEVIMVLVFLYLCISWFSLNFVFSLLNQWAVVSLFFNFLFFFLWVFSILAESNRSPFDFSEGESELVSGFNVEYMGGFFSFIFIGEYSVILFFCLLSGLLFFSGLWGGFISVFLFVFFLWVRSSFPRLRYDLLMEVSWKGLLFLLMGGFFFLFVFDL